jgi:hypothetical protein
MRRVTRFRQPSQFPLFRLPSNILRWESLPVDVRQEALALLVQWLRAHARGDGQYANAEVHDE